MYGNIGPYKLIGILGRGGMGVVYKGYETSLNRFVAIKVLNDAMAHDQSVKERFLREARSMAALNDPHIIQIYFIGDHDGQTFFTMEFVDGESLSSLLQREGKLKPDQAAKIIYQTALGLASAHERGVIHRDIKPGNLMISRRGGVKIADFGIALSASDLTKKLTTTGEFVGTPGYLSPEVCQGRPVDQRSDIFSLGIVLFECLAGRMPFTDESPLGLMLEVVKEEIPDVCALNKDVDAELSRVLSKMVAKDPNDRFQTCAELAAALQNHPLVAHGAPLIIPTQNAKLGPIVRAPGAAPSQTIVAPSSEALAAASPALALSSARGKKPAPKSARSPFVFAAAVIAIALVLAGAWGWHLHTLNALSSAARPTVQSKTTATSQATAPSRTIAVNAAGSLDTSAGGGSVAHAQSASSSQSPVDPALLDAMWLNDVPDDFFDLPTTPGSTNVATPITHLPSYTNYSANFAPVAPFVVPMVYSPPPAYVVAAPWRFGIGLNIGIGYWAARIAAPRPIWFGPTLPIAPMPSVPPSVAVQPGPRIFAESRPLPPVPAPPTVAPMHSPASPTLTPATNVTRVATTNNVAMPQRTPIVQPRVAPATSAIPTTASPTITPMRQRLAAQNANGANRPFARANLQNGIARQNAQAAAQAEKAKLAKAASKPKPVAERVRRREPR